MRMGKNVVNSDLGLQYAGSQRFAGVVELLEHFHRQKATDGQSEDRRCKCLKLFWDGWLVIWNVFYFSIYCEFHNSNISQLSQRSLKKWLVPFWRFRSLKFRAVTDRNQISIDILGPDGDHDGSLKETSFP